jgi:hypothetical protein
MPPPILPIKPFFLLLKPNFPIFKMRFPFFDRYFYDYFVKIVGYLNYQILIINRGSESNPLF